MPRVRKYHEGGKGPGHPHYTIDNKAERQAADASDYYERYPERRPEAIAKKKEEKGTLFDSAADFFQYSPIIGEIVDLINIPYVASTGKDIYKGEPQSVQSAAAWGVGGLLLPNLIQKPAKWLIKQGAKNAEDIAYILRYHLNRNPADIPADLKPLLDFSKKNNKMRDFLYAKTDTFPFADMDNVGSNRLKDVGGDLHSYIVKNRPDLVDKFSIENFENGMFDEVTRAWGDNYLVSLRGVRDAKNVDEAAEFLTSSKGGGERVQGPGINTSGSLNQVEPFGSGSKGYVGRLKVNEPYSSSANASTILDNIYNLEKEGGKLIPKQVSAGGVNYESLSRDNIVDGINTIDGTNVRLIKENTPVTVEDIIKTEGNDLSKIFRNPSEVTTLGHPSLQNSDSDKVLDWTQNSRNDLNEIYNAILKKDSYKQGGALKGLMKKYNEGGLFQRLRDKRAERRIDKTPVRQARTSELLDVLASDQPTTKGRYYPKEKEIVMYRDDDPDTLKHEQVHASQYGPLQRLSYLLKFNDSARIQDPAKRKTYRKLTSGKNIVDDREFNPAGQYVLSRGEEFEAVLDTGVNAAKEQGVDFSKSYDDILSQLLSAPSPTNNMTGLRKFMDNKFTKEQRDLILKSIR